MTTFTLKYIAAGGNRHPAAADWDTSAGLLAYGSERNIGLWNPLVVNVPYSGIETAHS